MQYNSTAKNQKHNQNRSGTNEKESTEIDSNEDNSVTKTATLQCTQRWFSRCCFFRGKSVLLNNNKKKLGFKNFFEMLKTSWETGNYFLVSEGKLCKKKKNRRAKKSEITMGSKRMFFGGGFKNCRFFEPPGL